MITTSHSTPAGVGTSVLGKIWLASAVAVVDPVHLPHNALAPPVHIEQLVADRTTYDAASGLRLPPRVCDLQIDYTALSLVAPEKNQFRVKLEGRDADWQNVGTRRQAFYADLGPGTYRFRVVASNNSGVWNEAGAALEFSLVRRDRRSGDHRAPLDDLPTARRAARAAVQLDARCTRQRTDAQRAGSARHAAPELPGCAAAVSVSGERHQEASGRSQRTAGSCARPGRGGDHRRPQRHTRPTCVRDEAYRIAGEALRNAFNHAQARHIVVTIHYEPRQFRLIVRDDGKGIEAETMKRQQVAGHFGLRGLRERAAIVKGRLDIRSAAAAGTEIELSVPAAIAYGAAGGRSWWSRLFGR